MFKGVAKYLQSTINWGIHFHLPLQLDHPDFTPSVWYDIKSDNTVPFNVDIIQPLLIGFFDAAHANDLRKQCSTTGLVYTFCGGAIVYKSKAQLVTAGSSTEAEFIAAHTAAKITRYLQMILKQLGYEQSVPTPIHIDNMLALKIINDNMSPIEQTWHMNICYFSIQDWCEEGSIIMQHVPDIINLSDDLTKPLGYILHACHCCRIMGHYH